VCTKLPSLRVQSKMTEPNLRHADMKDEVHTLPNAHRAGTPTFAEFCMRLLFPCLCAIFAVSAVCHAQAPISDHSAVDPLKIVRDTSYNELRAANDGHPFRYRTHKIDDGKSSVKLVVETRDGDMSRLIESDDKPLDADANQKELARLNHLRDNPDEQARKHKREQADSGHEDEMIKLLPQAFVYTYVGMVPGPNGPCYRLKFEPNSAFTPPDRQAEVYHGMAGEIWIDQAQQRMVKLDAHLVSDVNFGYGFLGRLFQGGTILVEQKDVGEHHWETTHERLDLSGKILMVKALRINTTEDSSDFQPVPDTGYKPAIALLDSSPIP